MLVDRMWRGQHAEAAAARRSQRALLRARSHHRRVPVRHAVHLPELEQGLRREGTADAGSRIELEPGGQLPRLSDGRRRDELSRRRPTARSPACSIWRIRKPARSTSARRRCRRKASEYLGQRAGPRRAARARSERPGAERRDQGDRSGDRQDRLGLQAVPGIARQTACWRPPAACCSRPRATATSSRSTPRPGKHLWHYQTGGNHAASPISYAIDGRQYVALTAGNVLYSFALPE